MIQIPEIRLQSLVDVIFKKLRDDYVDASDKTVTVLYRMFNGLVFGNYDFLENAVSIFTSAVDDPRAIDTRLMYDSSRASIPTVHITIPNQQPTISDGIGLDAGYNDDQGIGAEPTAVTESYNRTLGSKFNLVITGSSSFEVLLIYYVLYVCLNNNVESLDINGFRNPKIYGQEMSVNNKLTPVAYARILVLDSFFELKIPKFGEVDIVNSITLTGTAYD
jgi:hypothetical protein